MWVLRPMALALVAAVALGTTARVTAMARPTGAEIVRAFAKQGIRVNGAEARGIRDDVLVALDDARAHGIGNSKVDFAAVQIASELGLDTSPGSNTVRNVVAALGYLLDHTQPARSRRVTGRSPREDWARYFDHTVNLWREPDFLGLVQRKGFSPVKISWEDIGRHQGSVWGDRISDVGIWVRSNEADPATAQLALSVRRDENFRDKVLLVPADRVKVHQRVGARTVEKTLRERLAELGLESRTRDKNVIVSNQFAIAPVPAHGMQGAWPAGVPPRAAFTFSIFPYGSTNFVITDVIEGSHEAVVGPGHHQLLFARVGRERAPFTASRAEDRPDLLKLERELKAQGMDVDVQRYYLIQVPLRRDAVGVQLSNMGTPPWHRFSFDEGLSIGVEGGVEGGVPGGVLGGVVGGVVGGMPEAPLPSPAEVAPPKENRAREAAGLTRVAIGHGAPEGPYFEGARYRGARAEEPVRVTVVYFVTPVGRVTQKDMETFAAAFSQWDSQAIWGGSFVTKETF